MQLDRRALVSRPAARRIRALEAERLLVVWTDSRESLWLVAFPIMALSVQAKLEPSMSLLLDFTHMLLPALALDQVATTFTYVSGAIQ